MIKDIIVHLDGSADDTDSIAYGEGVAASFGAHLRGLYLNVLPEMHLSMAQFAAASAIITAAQDDARTQGDRIEQTLARRFQTLAVPAEVRRFDLFAHALSETVASLARAADLIVAARPYGRDRPEHWPRLVEAALFASGRGVLILPQASSTAHRPIETVLVAWNDTRGWPGRSLRPCLSLKRRVGSWSPWWTTTISTRTARGLLQASCATLAITASRSISAIVARGSHVRCPSQ